MWSLGVVVDPPGFDDPASSVSSHPLCHYRIPAHADFRLGPGALRSGQGCRSRAFGAMTLPGRIQPACVERPAFKGTFAIPLLPHRVALAAATRRGAAIRFAEIAYDYHRRLPLRQHSLSG